MNISAITIPITFAPSPSGSRTGRKVGAKLNMPLDSISKAHTLQPHSIEADGAHNANQPQGGNAFVTNGLIQSVSRTSGNGAGGGSHSWSRAGEQ
jgi:hypothetical protein